MYVFLSRFKLLMLHSRYSLPYVSRIVCLGASFIFRAILRSNPVSDNYTNLTT
jgi:hypothetical protein